MINLIITISFFVTLSAIILIANYIVNYGGMKRLKLARSHLVHKASLFSSSSVEDFIERSGVGASDYNSAILILDFLARLLCIPTERLTFDFAMRDIFVVVDEKSRGCEVHPFSTDIIEGISRLSDKRLWNDNIPSNIIDDDSLIDFVMSMSLCEFIRFFSPLVKTPLTRRASRTPA